MAKMNRERAVKERRALKQEKKDERKAARNAEGAESTESTEGTEETLSAIDEEAPRLIP